MYLFFDVETTGMPKSWKAPMTDTFNWPHVVQLAWQLYDEQRILLEVGDHIIQPEGWTIPYASERIHKISTERAKEEGKPIKAVLEIFKIVIDKAEFIIAHNIDFDKKVIGAEFIRKEITHKLFNISHFCTMRESTSFCKIPGRAGQYKWPKLEELHQKLFGAKFADAHNALADTQATANCFFKLLDLEAIELF